MPLSDESSRLWAITCLFNPAGYRIRGENFHIFSEHLPLPLIAVELSFDGQFCLKEGDAEKLIQIQGGDRMWQKERLLNIALRALPAHCDQVAWIDADILIRDPAWPKAVSKALEEVAVVQPFETVHNLGPSGQRVSKTVSTVSVLRQAPSPSDILSTTVNRAGGNPCSGHVWAARREALDRRGFYDGCIVGGGDTAFLCGALGVFGEVVRIHHMGQAQADRYLRWAEPVYQDIQGSVKALPFEIEHLWHGSMADRNGRQRHLDLAEVGFDPNRDLTLTDDGAWRWATPRPELHQCVLNYFQARNEDVAVMA
jgi:hypothetical protein